MKLKQIRPIFARLDVLLCLACGSLFVFFPDIDLYVAAQFYDGEMFHMRKSEPVIFIYDLFAKLHIPIALLLLTSLAILYFKKGDHGEWKKRIRFLFFALLVGPGLFVNFALKDNSFGRPRPVHIEEFGGKHQFAPMLTYSGQCKQNCSFVSGHAALGFYFVALGWAFGRREWFMAGIAIGVLVGGVRIVQGGHFLSDVVFSFWSVYFVCILLGFKYQYCWKSRRNALRAEEQQLEPPN